jgi:hypothetical protein
VISLAANKTTATALAAHSRCAIII